MNMISNDINESSNSTRRILLFNKIDLNDKFNQSCAGKDQLLSQLSAVHGMSCITEMGLEKLEQLLSNEVTQVLSKCVEDSGDSIFGEDVCLISRERHKYHIMRCIDHLNAFLSCDLPMDIAAEELRYQLCILICFFLNILSLYQACDA